MSRFDNEVRVSLSVLDRLIDYEPEVSREAPASRTKSLRLLKQAVRRDLEWLFNTRQTPALPAGLSEALRSVYAYGLPDFTNLSSRNISDHSRLRRAVEMAIEAFEPRLEDVQVIVEPAVDTVRMLQFRIDARLKLDPVPEPVTFDTSFHIGSAEFRVKGEA